MLAPNRGRFEAESYLYTTETANTSSSALTYSSAVWWLPMSVPRMSDDHDMAEPEDTPMLEAI